jgi:outer membrane protein assembly factor BamB
MTWPGRVCAYDPATGAEWWSCSGLKPLVYTSPLHAGGVVVAMGGFLGPALAVRAGGEGDVTETRRLWFHPQTKQRVGSGVIHEGHVYILNEPGVAECIELETGRVVWEERVAGKGPRSTTWSSLVLSDGMLYGLNQSGDTVIFRARPQFEMVGVNSLGEPSNSSVVIVDGQVFIRTFQSLWCVAAKDPK